MPTQLKIGDRRRGSFRPGLRRTVIRIFSLAALLLIALSLFLGCDPLEDSPSLSGTSGQLRMGRQVPPIRERDAIGAIRSRITRTDPGFTRLVRAEGYGVVFKDEENSGADHRMTRRLQQRLFELNRRTVQQWPGVHVRVTEAWDENGEHGPRSAHYEGRAADLTTSDMDSSKLGRLAWLAVQSGFDWVYYENRTHIHVSVRR